MTDQLKRAIHEAKTAKTTSNPTDKAGASSEEQNFDMSESTYKTTHTAVRKARRFAMQGLYEWLVTDRRFETTDKLGWKDNAPHDIAARTRATNAMHTVHIGYYHEMMRDIPEQIEALDALIEQHLDRKVEQLDTVEHAILLIGAYELQNRLEIPYKVVLDEAMKLNNHFGATDAHKLINAVLDRLAIELRALEVDADTKANKRTSQKAAAQPQAVSQATTNTESATSPADKPTASNKPRISANKTNVKRDRPNKSSTATKQAIKNAAAAPATADSVDDSNAKNTDTDNTVTNDKD
ncbi:MAG: transcription antitermination factor NusB [Psychrobacter sp.]